MMSHDKFENKKIPASLLFLCGCFFRIIFLVLHSPKAQPIKEVV